MSSIRKRRTHKVRSKSPQQLWQTKPNSHVPLLPLEFEMFPGDGQGDVPKGHDQPITGLTRSKQGSITSPKLEGGVQIPWMEHVSLSHRVTEGGSDPCQIAQATRDSHGHHQARHGSPIQQMAQSSPSRQILLTTSPHKVTRSRDSLTHRKLTKSSPCKDTKGPVKCKRTQVSSPYQVTDGYCEKVDIANVQCKDAKAHNFKSHFLRYSDLQHAVCLHPYDQYFKRDSKPADNKVMHCKTPNGNNCHMNMTPTALGLNLTRNLSPAPVTRFDDNPTIHSKRTPCPTQVQCAGHHVLPHDGGQHITCLQDHSPPAHLISDLCEEDEGPKGHWLNLDGEYVCDHLPLAETLPKKPTPKPRVGVRPRAEFLVQVTPEQTEPRGPEQTEPSAPEKTAPRGPEQTVLSVPEKTAPRSPEDNEPRALIQDKPCALENIEHRDHTPEHNQRRTLEHSELRALEQTETRAPNEIGHGDILSGVRVSGLKLEESDSFYTCAQSFFSTSSPRSVGVSNRGNRDRSGMCKEHNDQFTGRDTPLSKSVCAQTQTRDPPNTSNLAKSLPNKMDDLERKNAHCSEDDDSLCAYLSKPDNRKHVDALWGSFCIGKSRERSLRGYLDASHPDWNTSTCSDKVPAASTEQTITELELWLWLQEKLSCNIL